MPLSLVPSARVEEILQSLVNHQRHISIVRNMAREIERLEEDNTQLRAAVQMYRAVLSRRAGPRAV